MTYNAEQVAFMLAEAIDENRAYKSWHVSTQHLMTLVERVVAAERQWLIDSGLIGVLKHCEDLLREDGHEDAMNDVQNMIAKIRTRGQA